MVTCLCRICLMTTCLLVWFSGTAKAQLVGVLPCMASGLNAGFLNVTVINDTATFELPQKNECQTDQANAVVHLSTVMKEHAIAEISINSEGATIKNQSESNQEWLFIKNMTPSPKPVMLFDELKEDSGVAYINDQTMVFLGDLIGALVAVNRVYPLGFWLPPYPESESESSTAPTATSSSSLPTLTPTPTPTPTPSPTTVYLEKYVTSFSPDAAPIAYSKELDTDIVVFFTATERSMLTVIRADDNGLTVSTPMPTPDPVSILNVRSSVLGVALTIENHASPTIIPASTEATKTEVTGTLTYLVRKHSSIPLVSQEKTSKTLERTLTDSISGSPTLGVAPTPPTKPARRNAGLRAEYQDLCSDMDRVFQGIGRAAPHETEEEVLICLRLTEEQFINWKKDLKKRLLTPLESIEVKSDKVEGNLENLKEIASILSKLNTNYPSEHFYERLWSSFLDDVVPVKKDDDQELAVWLFSARYNYLKSAQEELWQSKFKEVVDWFWNVKLQFDRDQNERVIQIGYQNLDQSDVRNIKELLSLLLTSEGQFVGLLEEHKKYQVELEQYESELRDQLAIEADWQRVLEERISKVAALQESGAGEAELKEAQDELKSLQECHSRVMGIYNQSSEDILLFLARLARLQAGFIRETDRTRGRRGAETELARAARAVDMSRFEWVSVARNCYVILLSALKHLASIRIEQSLEVIASLAQMHGNQDIVSPLGRAVRTMDTDNIRLESLRLLWPYYE